jgi:sigma-B regulation protein RsbU (phosphoserine phosphatase)
VTEAQDEEQAFYGESRLVSRLKRMVRLTATEVVENIIDAVHDFAGEAAQSDDVTLMVAKRGDDVAAGRVL